MAAGRLSVNMCSDEWNTTNGIHGQVSIHTFDAAGRAYATAELHMAFI